MNKSTAIELNVSGGDVLEMGVPKHKSGFLVVDTSGPNIHFVKVIHDGEPTLPGPICDMPKDHRCWTTVQRGAYEREQVNAVLALVKR